MATKEKQEAVSTPAEQTAEPESAPVEEKTTIEPQESADTTVEPEEDSKSVPYERFKEVNDKYKDLESKVTQIIQNQTPQEQYQPPTADPDTDQYVDYRAEQKARAIYEANETARFEAKHVKEFEKDPLLRAAFMLEAQNTMAKGEYVDRDSALEAAKKALEERLTPATDKAKEEGVKEGQDIAKTKQQLGAVGETGKQPEVDVDKLSAAEYEKYMNIPRV